MIEILMDEGLLLALVLCGVLAFLGIRFRMLSLRAVSSMGLVIVSFQWYNLEGSILIMALLWMLAVGIFMVDGRSA